MQYEIRAMSVGEILDTAFQLVRNHAKVILGVALIAYLPMAVMVALLGQIAPTIESEGEVGLNTGFLLATLGMSFFAMLIVMPVASAGVTYAISNFYTGKTATIGEAFKTGFSLLLPLMGTQFLMWFFVLGGLLLFIFPGLYLLLVWLLIVQVMVMERKFGFRALGRSRELMIGNLLRGLGVSIVGSIIVGVLGQGLGLALGFVPLLGDAAGVMAQAVGFAYLSAVYVLLYLDIRCRKEAFDLEHLAQMVEGSGSGHAPVIQTP